MDDYTQMIKRMNNAELIELSKALKVIHRYREISRDLLITKILDALTDMGGFEPSFELKNPAVSIKGMKKSFGKNVAVENLDLDIHPGEIVGLVGPNGAGKTTTLRVMTGIIRPDSGDVLINGKKLSESPVESKRLIGYIPERPTCYPNLRVKEYVTFIAKVYGIPSHETLIRTSYFNNMLQLEPFMRSFIGTLSKGNLQRTLLAGIFVRPPPFILAFDEPIYGLDPRGAWSLKRHLRHLRDQGSAILVSTHILEIAQGLCDRFVIMDKGEVVGRGTLSELSHLHPGINSLEEAFLELTGGIPEAE